MKNFKMEIQSEYSMNIPQWEIFLFKKYKKNYR